ncbi:Extracellular membrane protein, CFEM domain protein [Metarhizium album ARSEF 1941]|uniref:Extracellular membrane protein, CFEM domain protein n=1 Tax=Metarhizium album (strain ARSEF 1941) TaxID=1081103 RepID=A0A0B2X0W7_METAS|nr:Extracellular membrane protein, CFEM domain protein [Metarhizium album ARSEF 1941]KHN99953.1 Extracellular membrane protein, CFEM domain protein [Metarhizium album ARSEF 1941]
MKSSFIILAAAAAFAAAQLDQLDKIPQCAQPCVSSAIDGTNIAGCKAADIRCVCGNKDFIAGISCCLQKSCSPSEIESTINFANKLCAASGVDTPKQLVCPSGSGSPSGATQTKNTSPTGSGTAATATAAATHTGGAAAAPTFGNAVGLVGAALAFAAAL